MSNAHFSYCRAEKPPVFMQYTHIRILRIVSIYPRYIQEIKSIAMSKAEHDIHNGILNPKLKELERWGLVLRNNPNVPRSSGYQYSITPDGLEALQVFDEVEKQMALAPSVFV